MEKKYIEPEKLAKTTGPYSHGIHIRLNEADLIFASGQVAVDAKGNTVGIGDVSLQTDQVLRNLQHVLEKCGATLSDVVKVTVFLRNMEHRDTVAKVRSRFFKGNLPASTLVEVSKLAHQDWLVEIEAIALVPRQR